MFISGENCSSPGFIINVMTGLRSSRTGKPTRVSWRCGKRNIPAITWSMNMMTPIWNLPGQGSGSNADAVIEQAADGQRVVADQLRRQAESRAARQQAIYLASILTHRAPDTLPGFQYRDYGTLVSLGQADAVGILRRAVGNRNVRVKGGFALAMSAAFHTGHT